MFEYLGIVDEEEDPPKQYGHRGIPSAQCSCGRFAKYLGTRYGYNGCWSTEHVSVNCSRCGVVEYQTI